MINHAFAADRRPAFNNNVRANLGSIADEYIFANDRVGTYFDIASQTGAGIYHCGFMNLAQGNHYIINFHLRINSSWGIVRLTQ